MSNNATNPTYPVQQEHSPSVLLFRNEGSRSLQIIGDLVADGSTVPPGSLFEIDVGACNGRVQLTLCDGALQVDGPGQDLLAIERDGACGF